VRRALAILLVASACGPGTPLDEARRLQDEEKNTAASIEPLRRFLEQSPDDPEANYRYGLALAATQREAHAKWALHKAMTSDEWYERSALLLAGILIRTGEYEAAVEVCDGLLERGADEETVLLLRAHANLGTRRRYEQVLADADRILEIDPESTDALVPRTVALLGLGREEEAAAGIDQLEDLHRDDSLGLHGSVGYCLARATFALEKGDRKLAGERYEVCLGHFPGNAALVGDAVAFFDEEGRPERSLEIMQRALEEQPENHAYRVALAMRIHEGGDPERAEALLREGAEKLESPVDAAEAWASVGTYNLEHGDYEEAAEAYARARQLDPTGSEKLRFAHADALVVAGRYEQALEIARGLGVPAYRELIEGRVALERGDARAALEHFTAGQMVWPNNPYARYYAAVAAEQLGDFERAAEEYRGAMRADVRATDAYLRLARIYAASGRDDDALTALGFEPGGRPEEAQAAILRLELTVRRGQKENPTPGLLERPENWGAGVAAMARGIREREGAKAALEYLRGLDRLDFGDPLHAEATAAWIDAAAVGGSPGEALRKVEVALAAQPRAGWLHALRGLALERSGAAPDRAREAYEAALELDPKELRALRALAELERRAGAPKRALELAERALALDPRSAETQHVAARALLAAGRESDAQARLVALLREHPHDAEAALSLAKLYARGGNLQRAESLAHRAVYFRGGPEAVALAEELRGRDSPSAQGPVSGRGAEAPAQRAAGERSSPDP
jgi:tetratricopeptide (TPR) repeat protein